MEIYVLILAFIVLATFSGLGVYLGVKNRGKIYKEELNLATVKEHLSIQTAKNTALQEANIELKRLYEDMKFELGLIKIQLSQRDRDYFNLLEKYSKKQ